MLKILNNDKFTTAQNRHFLVSLKIPILNTLPVRAKALPLTDRGLKIGINHCYCCPMRISKARLMLLPFQGATALTRKPQGVASLALGYVLHWAFSPPLLNPKLQFLIPQNCTRYFLPLLNIRRVCIQSITRRFFCTPLKMPAKNTDLIRYYN